MASDKRLDFGYDGCMAELVVPVSITEARTRLNAIVDEVAEGGDPVVIANHGRPRAVVISWEYYQRLRRLESSEDADER